MAESVVSSVVQALGNFLIQEAKFLGGVTEQVEQMQFELVLMQSYLEDADKKQYKDKRVQACVSRIRELAYDAEDAIETFALKIASRRGGGIQSAFKRYACITSEVAELHKLGSEIEAIKAHISDLTRSLETYGITHSIREGEGLSSEQGVLRRSYSHVVEEHIVGLSEDTETLVGHLVNNEKNCPVVSIWGMGGQGKTTLAKEVYRHLSIKDYFDGVAWASISQQCRTRDVWEGILIKLTSPSENERKEIVNLKHEELARRLYKVQLQRKYLVILDDIWSIRAWKSLSPAFPVGVEGSRSKMLLTTRNKDVAQHVNSERGFLWEPRNLTEDQSWELLKKRAFHRKDPDSTTMRRIEALGREMVRRCKFLPLAIAVLGGILATKHEVDEWKIVLKNINSYIRGRGLEQQEYGVYEVLALSYDELPYQLKPCFLHLAHYPEDYEISTNKLVKMWVAAGIVSPMEQRVEEEETIEDVAECYLGELLDRCMVQVGKRVSSTGRVKTCRLHDLMRDMCLSKANEENFLKIHLQDRGKKVDPRQVHRFAVYLREVRLKDFPIQGRIAHLRSLLFFATHERETIILQKVQSQIANFKLLKILDFERRYMGGKYYVIDDAGEHLARVIGNLINLRYFSLNSCFKVDIPSSIGKLRFLQTLILRGHHIRIPKIIWKMEQLRHICFSKYGYRHMKKTCGKVRLGNLSNLQTLQGVDSDLFDIKEVTKLANLRKLHFNCRIVKLPEYSQFPKNLTELTLRGSELEEDPMPTLENLPNLTILGLIEIAFTGKEMVCSSKGFPQLKSLLLGGLAHLEEWRVDEEAMPTLCELQIEFCKKLKMVPDGLRFVTTLRELKIINMPEEFNKRLRVVNEGEREGEGEGGGEGEDLYKVQHVPSIILPNQR